MIEQLQTLEQLQQIDLKIDDIKRNQIEYPQRIQELKDQIEAELQVLKETERSAEEVSKQRRSKEVDLQRLEERMEKDREKLMQVKTNKEYHAIQKEIENMRADRDELETEILKLMEQGEEAEHEARRTRERFKGFEAKNLEQIQKLTGDLERIDDTLEQMVDQYDDIASRIDSELIDRYLHVRKLRRGVAVVPVIKGTCQGCNMKIPPQVYNQVIRHEEIITCPNCRRILYLSEG